MDNDTNCMDKDSNYMCIPNKTGPETCLEADNDKQTEVTQVERPKRLVVKPKRLIEE